MNLNNYLPLSGGNMYGHIFMHEGGIIPPDGNIYINTQGYSNYISNIFDNLYFMLGSIDIDSLITGHLDGDVLTLNI